MGKIFQIGIIGLILVSCRFSPLPITGDVPRKIMIQQNDNLQEIFENHDLNPENVLIIGKDGTAVWLEKPAISHLQLTHKNGCWYSESTDLPEVANIKDIEEISVFSPTAMYQITLIMPDYSYSLTPFQAICKQFEVLGASSKNGFHCKKMQKKESFPPFLPLSDSLEIVLTDDSNQVVSSQFFHSIQLQNFYFGIKQDTICTIKAIP